jgi:hypothetical protein
MMSIYEWEAMLIRMEGPDYNGQILLTCVLLLPVSSKETEGERADRDSRLYPFRWREHPNLVVRFQEVTALLLSRGKIFRQ